MNEDVENIEEDEYIEDDEQVEDVDFLDEQAPTAPVVAMSTLPVTGEPRVDDAMARLTDLATLPVSEHVGVFEDVQRRLHDTLADLSGS